MDSVQHPPPSFLVCPYIRYKYFLKNSDRDTKFVKIDNPYYFSNDKADIDLPYHYFGHRLYPLYWCNNKESGYDFLCGACKSKEIGTTYYFCGECEDYYHKECVESASLIKSLFHPKHHLQLVHACSSENISCSCCGDNSLLSIRKVQEDGGYNDLRLYYYCFACKFGLDPVCEAKPSFMNYKKRHEHDLNHFPRKADLTCDVCGVVDSKALIYVCLLCDFVLHKNCIYLPFVIRISRHDHRLCFKYSISRILSCGVCRQKVDENYGNYSCMKDCSYAVHSKCATRKDVWDGKELEEEPEEDYEYLNSFEVIGDGIIQHISHSHHMKFERKTTNSMYDDEKRCQACIRPLYGGGIYVCMKSNCDFVLHEACANLPRTKQHIAHPNPFILQVSDTKNTFFCGYCHRFLYGFRYVCSKGGKSISIDVRCAAISEPFVQQCHPHPLFLSNELGKYRPCSICENEKVQTLNCIECSFSLCFYCATLPYEVRYEHDEHFLTLSYKENANLNWCEICEEIMDCEICEEIMDSTKWAYTCYECGTVFHIPCLLGKCAPYVRSAQNLLLDGQIFNIVSNNRLTRPICVDCGRRCQDKLMLEFYEDDRKLLYCYRHSDAEESW